MSPTLKQELCDLFDLSSELVNEVSDTLETIHEGNVQYKKGDAVTVSRGPHKGVKHTVGFVHHDGKLNLHPDVWPPQRIRYRLGGVTVTPDEVKPWDKAAHDRRVKDAHSGRPQTAKEKQDMADWKRTEKALQQSRNKRLSDLNHPTRQWPKESLDEQELPFGLESFQGPVSNAEMNRKKDTVAKAPNTEQDNTSSFDPTKKSSSQKEAEREKKLRAKADDEVENNMINQHNTKDDEVTFYPSTDNSSERTLGV